MKKILLATAAVALTAGAASADGVSLSGYGRFGVVYNSGFAKKAQVTSRFRLNIAATKTTDSGVEFGAKFRLQNDQGTDLGTSRAAGMTPNAATFWAKSGAFTLSVGNVSDAIDASGTYYNGDLGFLGYGDQEVLGASGIGYYSSSAYTNLTQVGVLATYAANGLTVNVSYMTPDQTTSSAIDSTAISADYAMGAFTFGAGYIKDGGFTTGVNASFASLEYAFGKSTVGLQVGKNAKAKLVSGVVTPVDAGTKWTLFGNTSLSNGLGIQGYVTKDQSASTGTGVGLGMSYDIGGATLSGSVARMLDKTTQADFGVKFSF